MWSHRQAASRLMSPHRAASVRLKVKGREDGVEYGCEGGEGEREGGGGGEGGGGEAGGGNGEGDAPSLVRGELRHLRTCLGHVVDVSWTCPVVCRSASRARTSEEATAAAAAAAVGCASSARAACSLERRST